MTKSRYIVDADSSLFPNVEEYEAQVDGVDWMFDVLVTDPEPLHHGGMYGEPVWPEVMDTTVTLVTARRFAKTDPEDGTEVDAEKALHVFFSVAEGAAQAWYDHLAGMAEDRAEAQYEARCL